jgi:sulfopyruvate decarboxylase subunit alpha
MSEGFDSTASDRAQHFYLKLADLGYDFFTGVPCSLLAALYPVLATANASYYPATREDLALGLAAGAVMSGRRPAVLIQNSGLGIIVNALFSLQKMYQLPLLLIVTWRGYGPDAPEHVEMGASMFPLLDLIGIPYRFATAPHSGEREFHQHPGPIALVVRPFEFA